MTPADLRAWQAHMGMSVQHASQAQADWCPQRETCARYVQRASNTGPQRKIHAMGKWPKGIPYPHQQEQA